MSAFWKDLRYAARMLLRAPGFAAVVILVLALGIGANSAIFSVVNAVLLRPLPFHDPERLFRLDEVNPKGNAIGVSPMDLDAFRQRTRVLDGATVSHWLNLTLTGPEGPENTYGAQVSSDCFRMLGRQPAIGRAFRDEEFRPGAQGVTILSDRLWQRRFQRDPRALGKSLMLNGKAYTVVGVMSPGFFYDQRRFDLWIPWQFTADESGRRTHRTSTVVRLKPGVTPQKAQAELASMLRDIAPEDARQGWSIRIEGMAHQLTERVRSSLIVLLGAVGFVLLIACLNVANLMLARGSERNREIAVRTALGASRLRLVRQLLAESLLLAVLGGVAGLLLGAGAAKGLVALYPERIPVPRLEETHLDSQVLLFTLALAVATGLLFGLLPAVRASRTDLLGGLKEGGRGSSGGSHSRRLRSLLVIVETALSLVLLIGAALMLRSFDRLMAVDPGFNPDRVLTLRVPLPSSITGKAEMPAYYTRILERLQSVPGINAAGVIAPLPMGDVDVNGTFAVEGHPVPPGETQLVKLRGASPGYFRAMGIGLRRGRVFTESDTAEAPPTAVVNEALVRKYFPNEDPIGKRITMDTEAKKNFMTIVGVVNDVKFSGLGGTPEPEMYRDYRQLFFAPFATSLVLRGQAEDAMRLAGVVQKEVRASNPDQPISDLKPMRAVVSENVSQPRFYTLLLGAFAVIALVLAATGLYGVLAYSVGRRTHEVGVRMALGASGRAILRLVVGEALLMVGAGVVLGIAGAFGLTRLIASQLYQTGTTDPLTFAAVSLLMFAVAAAASYVPARRALRVDPVVALRWE